MKSACPEADVRFLSFYDMVIDDEGILLSDGGHAAICIVYIPWNY